MPFRALSASLLAVGLLAGGCGTAAASTQPAASPAGRVVVTLGDSVPAGNACDCDPFPLLYARSQRATSVDLAVGGYKTTDVLRQLPGAHDDLARASTVLLMIGANDLGAAFDAHSSFDDAAEQVDTDVTLAVQQIQQVTGVRIVILGYWNVVLDGKVAASTYSAAQIRDSLDATQQANEALRTAATRTGAVYLSTDPAFHGADGSGDATALLAADGDHPNAAGHQAIADLIPPIP